MTRRTCATARVVGTEPRSIRRGSRTAWCRTAVSLLAVATTMSLDSPVTFAHDSAPAPSADATDLTYTVTGGDYLAGIAGVLGVKLSDFLTLNKLSALSAIHPGDILKVPQGGVVPATASSATTETKRSTASGIVYTVEAGDYLSKIATKLNVSLSSLLAANNMTISHLIVPGNQIVVPSGGTLPSAVAQPAPVVSPPTAVAQPAPVVAPPAPTTTYIVKPGDFLIDIAAKNGVTLKALLAANSLIASSVIVPGRTLTLPPATLPLAPPADLVPAQPPTTSSATAAPTSAGSISTVVAFLQAQLGKPYEFNKAGPDSYDCSGLVRAAYLQIGISLPHQSLLQSRLGSAVDWRVDDIRAGDLVFAYSTGKTYISHVGVAISSSQWISSSQTGVPVKIGTLPADDRIQAVRRIVPS